MSKLRVTGNTSINSEGNGFNFGRMDGIKSMEVSNNYAVGSKGHGFNFDTGPDLIAHGINPEVPRELLMQAAQEIKTLDLSDEEGIRSRLSKLNFLDWTTAAANIVTVATFLKSLTS
ncbi:hypothetical protein ACN5L3_002883 [Cronobacter malonaticus]